MHIVLTREPDGRVALTPLDGDGTVHRVTASELPAAVADREAHRPRWVWDDTNRWYPPLLAAGVRVERCVDVRLQRAILRRSPLTAGIELATAPHDDWDLPAGEAAPSDGLFSLDAHEPLDTAAEFHRQQAAAPSALNLLLAAESAGALIAAEIQHAGLPWDVAVHRRLLEEALGPRPAAGARPAKMQRLVEQIQHHLNASQLNPDSPAELVKALQHAGIRVSSTSRWELAKVAHPVVAPLLEYKSLARLLSANGWHWLDTHVRQGRFHPEYVPGAVPTGRWGSRGGGGALQLPKAVRSAVVADPGWMLVVADAAQLEPRILAAMAEDRGMLAAGRAGDLYAGIVADGAVATREQAKLALLGAMYGATSGESGRLLPALARAYPKAMGLVEAAARAGERGERVVTRLGRGSPLPDDQWRQEQADASGDGATEQQQARARDRARSWGRFTRNFVVQGTAAEWALCWMAALRRDLRDHRWLADAPHLAFFLHDELVVHCPAEEAEAVAEKVRAAAAEAGRLIFGALPVEFPLSVATVESYAEAK